MEYKLKIKPAIEPDERYKIEKTLEKTGYNVVDAGTFTDMSACEIFFKKNKCDKK